MDDVSLITGYQFEFSTAGQTEAVRLVTNDLKAWNQRIREEIQKSNFNWSFNLLRDVLRQIGKYGERTVGRINNAVGTATVRNKKFPADVRIDSELILSSSEPRRVDFFADFIALLAGPVSVRAFRALVAQQRTESEYQNLGPRVLSIDADRSINDAFVQAFNYRNSITVFYLIVYRCKEEPEGIGSYKPDNQPIFTHSFVLAMDTDEFYV